MVLGGNFDVLSTARFSLPSWAHPTIRAVPQCYRWCCCDADPCRVLRAAALARAQILRDGNGQRGLRRAGSSSPTITPGGDRHGTGLGGTDGSDLRDDLDRGFLRSLRPRLRPHPAPLRCCLRNRGRPIRASVERSGLEFVLDDASRLSCFSAPLTAALGLATAYLLVRQRFPGHQAFEFGTMLSFAIPGTVIGISYILAFNTPPIEVTGTDIDTRPLLRFPHPPAGIRAGVAAMAQIDKSLDEASLMLRAGSWTTVRLVILPLLRPAIVAALVFSFVRAMTAISAVIFLVSANYDMATSYIIGRVEYYWRTPWPPPSPIPRC